MENDVSSDKVEKEEKEVPEVQDPSEVQEVESFKDPPFDCDVALQSRGRLNKFRGTTSVTSEKSSASKMAPDPEVKVDQSESVEESSDDEALEERVATQIKAK